MPSAPSRLPVDHDRALAAAVNRRRILSFIGVGAVGLVAAACGSDSSSSASDTTAGTPATTGSSAPTTAATTAAGAADTTAADTTAAADTAAAETTATAADLTETPGETAGPFPADGTNDNGDGESADVLADARSVRSDIRSDLDGSNVQDGVPMTLTVKVLDDTTGSAVAGAALYIWHCNKTGEYSMYNSSMLGGDFSDRSFLRGVQITDANGEATFTTILPGRYQGRAFHIHFSVYGDAAYGDLRLTSQMAIDDDEIESLYTAAGYTESLRNETLNSNDNIFNDGVEHQLLTIAGDPASGLRATFTAVV